jgi:hypothetical protein
LGAILTVIMVILYVHAMVGLLNRVKAGAGFLIASQVLILLLPAVAGARYNSPISNRKGSRLHHFDHREYLLFQEAMEDPGFGPAQPETKDALTTASSRWRETRAAADAGR